VPASESMRMPLKASCLAGPSVLSSLIRKPMAVIMACALTMRPAHELGMEGGPGGPVVKKSSTIAVEGTSCAFISSTTAAITVET